ncbi:MAG: hypothetical protein JSS49_20485 [Planctomycetes bacterium]|nr:hypothetical protein [Planctomycetota bacterium]
MRSRKHEGSLSVHAVAGTYVVLLGMDIAETASTGLLGFTIIRETVGEPGKKILGGGKRFAKIHDADEFVRSDQAPIQSFLWGDYEAQPGVTYNYRVIAQYGEPGKLKAGDEVTVQIETERREDGVHSIYFNRGVAGSQAYSRHFGDHRRWYLVDKFGELKPQQLIKPEDVPDREAYKWLSRGLEEAMLDFIAQATGSGYSLRAAVYEFTYQPAIQAFVDALERGVDVRIVHHAKRETMYELKTQRDPKDGTDNWRVTTTSSWESGEEDVYKNKFIFPNKDVKDSIGQAADAAVSRVGLKDASNLPAFEKLMSERKNTTISHNKFIVLLKDGKPIQVWTGSTNFTAGGIFGQSNVGHVVRDEKIAKKYLAYWNKLAEDPTKSEMTAWTSAQTPDLGKVPPKNSITPIFSPRPKQDMLHWYAERIGDAKASVFFTAAFSVDDSFMKQLLKETSVADGEAYQRYIILESRTGLMKDKVKLLKPVKQNRLAWGDVLKPRSGDDPHIETLTGLNENVQYIHTKYLLIDPLSDDPLVMTGSANFSKASTTDNDENLLIIRGDTRVADVFLGEFMRLFKHFEIRNDLNSLSDAKFATANFLVENDSWLKNSFKEGTPEQQERILFR